MTGGTLETRKCAKNIGKPCLHVWPGSAWRESLASWMDTTDIRILNVAGPRASKAPGVGGFVREVLDEVRGLVGERG